MSLPVSEVLKLLGIKTDKLKPDVVSSISTLFKEIGSFLASQCSAPSSPEHSFPTMFTDLPSSQKYIQHSISFLRDGTTTKEVPSALATISDLKDVQDRILSSIKAFTPLATAPPIIPSSPKLKVPKVIKTHLSSSSLKQKKDGIYFTGLNTDSETIVFEKVLKKGLTLITFKFYGIDLSNGTPGCGFIDPSTGYPPSGQDIWQHGYGVEYHSSGGIYTRTHCRRDFSGFRDGDTISFEVDLRSSDPQKRIIRIAVNGIVSDEVLKCIPPAVKLAIELAVPMQHTTKPKFKTLSKSRPPFKKFKGTPTFSF